MRDDYEERSDVWSDDQRELFTSAHLFMMVVILYTFLRNSPMGLRCLPGVVRGK